MQGLNLTGLQPSLFGRPLASNEAGTGLLAKAPNGAGRSPLAKPPTLDLGRGTTPRMIHEPSLGLLPAKRFAKVVPTTPRLSGFASAARNAVPAVASALLMAGCRVELRDILAMLGVAGFSVLGGGIFSVYFILKEKLKDDPTTSSIR